MKLKLLFLLLSVASFAQIPQYYSEIDFTQDDSTLKSQLTDLITNTHTTELVYTSGSSGFLDTWAVLKESDLDQTNPNNVVLLYGWDNESTIVSENRTRGVNESCHTSSCIGKWVREHTFPKSLANPNLGTEYAGSDAHNLRAIDSQRNSSRSNKLFGNATTSTESHSIDSNSWYPGDEWIGDVARIIMYMYLRYPTQCIANDVATGGSTFATLNDMPDLLLQWNAQDPPSVFEIARNNVIAVNQGNRNPFIDNPYLATLLWNGPSATDSWNALNAPVYVQNEFKLYPTQTTGLIYTTTSTLSDYEISVYNSLGQLIKYIKTNSSIDISNQASGLYFIIISRGNFNQTFKIIKQF